MSNPFLNEGTKDIATAKLYENAIITDLEKVFHTNAPALTEGKHIYINTEDNLFKTFPAYNIGMLKWLLWHEQQHLNLKHHQRFYNYINELSAEETLDKFNVTKDEVNIIMDILVHDSLCKWFPELVETATTNYAQLRNRNSLKYTFKTYTLEEMLDEYKAFKEGKDDDTSTSKDDKEDTSTSKEDKDDKKEASSTAKSKSSSAKSETDKSSKSEQAHEAGGDTGEDTTSKDKKDDETLEDEHNKTNWDAAKKIDSKEFITETEAKQINQTIAKIKRKKIKIAHITKTLNGLSTEQRVRTYEVPSKIHVSKGVILKGHKKGRAKLYLVFDASGSMSCDMKMFKDIISKSIPQAMNCECEWFSGGTIFDRKDDIYTPKVSEEDLEAMSYRKEYHGGEYNDYYKAKFKDFMNIRAAGGYGDDGDRVIDLCVLAESKGYNPIGVTDGGGTVRYPEEVKKLKRTILVGSSSWWLEKVKKLNPNIQTICTDEDED